MQGMTRDNNYHVHHSAKFLIVVLSAMAYTTKPAGSEGSESNKCSGIFAGRVN